MFVELEAAILEPPEIPPGDLEDWELPSYDYDDQSLEYDLYFVNTNTVSYITPGDDNEYALIFMLDGSVLQSMRPYDVVKTQFNSFQLGLN